MLPALISYKYVLVFLGLVASGDIFLVGFIYSAHFGFITLYALFWIALAASAVSDFMWYIIGRSVGMHRLRKLPMLRSRAHLADKLAILFERNGVLLLLACKFLYGTRVIIQVLCGAHKMKYPKYFMVNVAGSFVWISFVIMVVTAIDASLSTLKSDLSEIEISLTIVVILFLLTRHFTAKFLQKEVPDRPDRSE